MLPGPGAAQLRDSRGTARSAHGHPLLPASTRKWVGGCGFWVPWRAEPWGGGWLSPPATVGMPRVVLSALPLHSAPQAGTELPLLGHSFFPAPCSTFCWMPSDPLVPPAVGDSVLSPGWGDPGRHSPRVGVWLLQRSLGPSRPALQGCGSSPVFDAPQQACSTLGLSRAHSSSLQSPLQSSPEPTPALAACGTASAR